MRRPEPWTGRLLLVEPDLPGDFNEFFEDLTAAVLEGLDNRLAFEAWADQRGDSA